MGDDDELPTEVASDYVTVGEHRFRVVVLSDGRRVFPEEEIHRMGSLLGINFLGQIAGAHISTQKKS